MAELRESTATPSRTPGFLPAVAVDSLRYGYWWSCATVSEAFLRVVETQFYIIFVKKKKKIGVSRMTPRQIGARRTLVRS
jgi:hypothetical protein